VGHQIFGVQHYGAGTIRPEQFPYKKIGPVRVLNSGATVPATLTPDGVLEIQAPSPTADDPDVVLVLKRLQ
jgi:hypothetical protein